MNFLLGVELRHKDHSSSMDNHGWNFRDRENSVSSFWHLLSDFCKWGSLTCAWSPSDNNFIDWELSVVSNFMGVELFFQVNLVHLRDEIESLRRLLDFIFLWWKNLSEFFLLLSFMNQVGDDRNKSCGTQNFSLIIWNLIDDVTHVIPIFDVIKYQGCCYINSI